MINETKKTNNYLLITLDDNDEIIESIESAFRQHDVKKAILVSAEGRLKNSRVAITRAGTIRQRTYSESLRIRSISGEFYKIKDDYLGDVHICLEKDYVHSITGVVFKGHADKEVKIKFKIISDISFGINKQKSSRPITLVKQKILDDVMKEPKPIIEA